MATVTITMAISAPGSFFEIFGVNMIISSDTRPVASVGRATLSKFLKYMIHFGMNCPGTSRRPSPKKSLIWVENIVSAIPAVKPTTIG